MKNYFKENYGYFVESKDNLDYWIINNVIFPTSYQYLDKKVCYRFEIENGFCYPKFMGLISREYLNNFLKI